eukprot:snap_masked-scaffold_43-processed-gene-0.17-mRNA-1 protein AED:1.00 eAED:1.00 QI:0/0/0/0/1/1/2/0/67
MLVTDSSRNNPATYTIAQFTKKNQDRDIKRNLIMVAGLDITTYREKIKHYKLNQQKDLTLVLMSQNI